MPESVTPTGAGKSALSGAAIGFCGKIPVRGDFISVGLPRGFVDPWYDWFQRCLPASRRVLGDDWEPAWNEAPIWHFALSPGICGPDAALGLWMPSVDRVGRHFPVTFAVLASGEDVRGLVRDGGGFLAAAEAAGLDALADDLEPEEIERRIMPQAWEGLAASALAPDLPVTGRVAMWWTDGGPRVASAVFTTAAMPDAEGFTSMLAAGATAPEAGEGGL